MTKREELEQQGFKTYENDEIQVFWNPSICQHAGKCAKGNINVFNPKRRPWIDLSQAPAEEIAAILGQCPSKALQYELKTGVCIEFEGDNNRSAAYKNGKLIGECEFSPSESRWIIAHTGVRPAYEGQGIAKKLVLKVIEAARAKQVKILPLCPYAKKMMCGKEEYQDVL